MKLITRDIFEPAVITIQRVKYPSLLRLTWNFVGLVHSGRYGGPVLIEDACWRTVSGVVFRVKNTGVWLQFRRFGNMGVGQYRVKRGNESAT